MGTFNDSGYTPSTAGQIADEIRDAIDTEIGAQDYGTASTPTIAGGWTLGLGATLAAQEERAALIVDAVDPRTARGALLDGHADAVAITRQAATSSIYVMRGATISGVSILRAGDILQDDTAAANLWAVVTTVTVTTSDTLITIQAQATGPIVLDTVINTYFTPITPIANAPAMSYRSSFGDPFTIGSARETDPELRVRMQRSRAAVPSPTRDGIRSGLLALTWIQAASIVRTAPHTIAAYIYPTPATATQEQEAIDAVGYRVAAGTLTTAGTGTTVSGDYTTADGSTVAIVLTVPAAQTVDVVVALTYAAGLPTADQATARADAEAVIVSVFAALDVGQALSYAGTYCAIYDVEGVIGLTLTLDGGTSDVSPATSTTQLTRGTVTIT